MNQLSDYIKEYIAFTKDECDMIIEFYEDNLDHTRSSEVYSAQNHENLQSVDRVGRKSTEMSVPLDAPVDNLISSKII